MLAIFLSVFYITKKNNDVTFHLTTHQTEGLNTTINNIIIQSLYIYKYHQQFKNTKNKIKKQIVL